jgi:hypothetical protein
MCPLTPRSPLVGNVRYPWLLTWDSWSKGVGPLYRKAGLTDLRWIRRGNAGELRADVVDDVKIVVRTHRLTDDLPIRLP